MELTPKGRPKDGYYYDVICPEHGKTDGFCIGKILVCLKCGKEYGKDKWVIKLDIGGSSSG